MAGIENILATFVEQPTMWLKTNTSGATSPANASEPGEDEEQLKRTKMLEQNRVSIQEIEHIGSDFFGAFISFETNTIDSTPT
jgi:hypothetical protein